MAVQDIRVPDLGGFSDVPVVEVFVNPGDVVKEEDSLISLESDKAVMDIPSPAAGEIVEVLIHSGDTVSEGDLIARAEVSGSGEKTAEPAEEAPAEEAPAEEAPAEEAPAEKAPAEKAAAPSAVPEPKKPLPPSDSSPGSGGPYHASPSVRSYARELSVPLSRLTGSGPKGRITRDDVQAYVKEALKRAESPANAAVPELQLEDFSRYGEVRREPLSRIQKISAAHLHAGWLNIPLVTHFDEADVTALETFRKERNAASDSEEVRLSILPFIVKAAVRVLKQFPRVRSSFDKNSGELIIKDFYRIGIAVDTPDGLVVPVVAEADGKTVGEIGRELAELSGRARAGRLKPADFAGAVFSISSLGGIGGTQFTPLVNAPQAAILGVSRAAVKPVWNGESFTPKTVLPFSLSYDHRIIDGAEGARFCRALADELEHYHRLLVG
jgi:pyruvate dehydrogenase E2 component (dihydrolipoamide acetyltransferase)